jgi:hypothetical protein
MAPRLALITLASVATLLGCALPGFEKVDSVEPEPNPGQMDSGMGMRARGPGCGRSAELPVACDDCIREHCCDLAEACGEGTECGDDLLEPITPVADFSTDFDPLLGCMQRRCDAECEVNWGCVDNYEWPAASEPVDLEVRVVDYADEEEGALADVTVMACDAVDPTCDSGRRAEGITGSDGKVLLSNLPGAFDGFYSFSGADYMDATVQWSEPIHRVTGFTQYQLRPSDVKALALITGVHDSADDMFEPGRGHLIFRIQGCLPMRYLSTGEFPQAETAGVHISFAPNDGATQVFYTEETGGVSVNLDATTIDALGGAFNVAPRNLTVTAVDVATDREVARGVVNVRVGAIGYMYLVARSQL